MTDIMGGIIACMILCGRPGFIDRTPPEIHCPSNIYQINDPMQFNARVLWEEPKCAYDNVDGKICRLNNVGGKPGFLYSEGDTKVGYTARDRAGNMGSCYFTITVNVVRCSMPAATERGYYICHPSAKPRYGTVCTYGCYPGYRINGDVNSECNKDGVWSVAAPLCEKVKCPPIGEVNHGLINCSDANYYQSKCVYTCKSGYAIQPGMTSLRTCSYNQRWVGPVPVCIDVERPTIEGCPSSILAYTDRNKLTSRVQWIAPTAHDNSWLGGSYRHANQTVGLPPNSEFPIGTTPIIYSAEDAQGNKAFPCRFHIYVRRLSCPTLYSNMDLRIQCPEGYGYGASCNFSCLGKKQLVGREVAECETIGQGNVADWQWGPTLRPPACEGSPCPELSPGDNSALACDEWLYGQFCKMFCRAGYDVHRTQKRRLENLFVCKENGVWDVSDPNLRLPHCTEMEPGRGTVASEIHYFSGDCCNATVQNLIRERFIEIWSSTPGYGSTCLNNPDQCHVDNIRVTCGPACSEKIKPMKEFEEFITTVHIEVSTSDIMKDLPLPIEEVFTYTEELLINATLSATQFPVTGSELEFDLIYKSYDMSDVKILCNHGFGPASFGCVGCFYGHYMSDTGECRPCPRHTYQDEKGSVNCKPCPNGTGTVENGVTSSYLCLDQCEPGYFSESGVAPCSPCGVGTYTNRSGSTSCDACPLVTTTISEGSLALNMCSPFDLSFTNSGEALVVVESTSVDFENFSIAASFQLGEMYRENTDILRVFSQNKIDQPTNLTVLTLSVEPEGLLRVTAFSRCVIALDSAQVNVSSGKWYHLFVSWTQQYSSSGILTVFSGGTRLTNLSCSVSDNAELPLKNVTVTLHLGSPLFVGLISDVNIWDEELNESTVMKVSSCGDTTLGNVVSWHDTPTQGVMAKVSVQIPSLCDDADECDSEPCLNGAECVDLLRDYDCLCPHGFKGRQCEINIDDCVDNECENNATCRDGVNSYTCICADPYKGDFCDVQIINGRWSEWGDWSSCSESCGGGTQSRERLCNNPPPDPDGQPCDGMPSDNQMCIAHPCPVCSDLTAPEHGGIICEDDELGGRNCTLYCETGYEFGDEPLDFYWCGPDTGHEWSFATDDNPKVQLPDCTAIGLPEKLRISHEMDYPTLPCVSEALHSLGELLQVHTRALPCIEDEVCAIEQLSVEGCNANSDTVHAKITLYVIREKEDGINLTEVIKDNGEELRGLTDKVQNLEDAAASLQAATEKGYFTVTYLSMLHYVNGHALSGEVICPSGTTSVNFYCVPCSAGYFANEDQICTKCPIGSFQSMQASSKCFDCPAGYTTDGRGSKSIHDCNVEISASWTSASLDDITTEIIQENNPPRYKGGESTGVVKIALSVGISAAIVMAAVMIVAFVTRSHKSNRVGPAVELSSTRCETPLSHQNLQFVSYGEPSSRVQDSVDDADEICMTNGVKTGSTSGNCGRSADVRVAWS